MNNLCTYGKTCFNFGSISTNVRVYWFVRLLSMCSELSLLLLVLAFSHYRLSTISVFSVFQLPCRARLWEQNLLNHSIAIRLLCFKKSANFSRIAILNWSKIREKKKVHKYFSNWFDNSNIYSATIERKRTIHICIAVAAAVCEYFARLQFIQSYSFQLLHNKLNIIDRWEKLADKRGRWRETERESGRKKPLMYIVDGIKLLLLCARNLLRDYLKWIKIVYGYSKNGTPLEMYIMINIFVFAFLDTFFCKCAGFWTILSLFYSVRFFFIYLLLFSYVYKKHGIEDSVNRYVLVLKNKYYIIASSQIHMKYLGPCIYFMCVLRLISFSNAVDII